MTGEEGSASLTFTYGALQQAPEDAGCSMKGHPSFGSFANECSKIPPGKQKMFADVPKPMECFARLPAPPGACYSDP